MRTWWLFSTLILNEKCLKSAKCFNYSCNNYFKASTLFEGPVYHTVCNVLNLMIFIMEQIRKSATNILMFLQTSLSCHVAFFFSNDQAVSIGCVLGWPGLPVWDYWYTFRYDDNVKPYFPRLVMYWFARYWQTGPVVNILIFLNLIV